MKLLLKIRYIIEKIQNRLLYGDLYYINGPEKLPPPLTKEQEEETFLLLSKNEKLAVKDL